ncbi:MAG: FG-GAP repeat protein, partial [Candidatus Aminicenantes bacterium]
MTTGDFDNDGFDDLAVGAPGESPGSAPESGYIFVFHGAVGGLYPFSGLSQAGLGANEAGDRFGVALPGSPAYKRRAFVEIDRMTGTGFPPQQWVDGNYIHTLESIYLKGGMVLDVRRDDTDIPNQVSVSQAELHNLMTANKNANFEEAGDKWSGYIVVVKSLTGSPGTFGVMFDHSTYDLNSFPREGCA